VTAPYTDVVLPVPEEPWLSRLRRDHRVWLVKEGCPAVVAWAWEPPEPGVVTGTGRIAINPLVNNHYQPVQIWYADTRGRGIDRSQLFAPIAGQLPEEEAPISEPVVRQLMRTITQLTSRVERLETALHRPSHVVFGHMEE